MNPPPYECGRNLETHNTEQRRARYLHKNYGITLEDFDRMLEEQDYRCAICRCNFKKRCVDHDHKNGIVPGLLCIRCNRGLGALKDTYQTVSSAAGYLARVEWSRLLQCKLAKR